MCFKGSIWYYFLFKWKQRSRSTVALLTPFPLSSLNLWQPRNPSFISSALPFILTVSLVTSQLISKDCNTGFQMLQCWSYVSIFFFKGMMQRKCWVWQCPPPFLVTWLQIRKWGGGTFQHCYPQIVANSQYSLKEDSYQPLAPSKGSASQKCVCSLVTRTSVTNSSTQFKHNSNCKW